MLRMRRNYTIRVFRLGGITLVVLLGLTYISQWFRLHARFSAMVIGGTVAAVDEYVMRRLPGDLEAAVPGGFLAS